MQHFRCNAGLANVTQKSEDKANKDAALSNSALRIRRNVEAALAERVPAALTPAPRGERERVACGVEGVDAALEGGVPCGAITELVGPDGSGRTTVALAYVAAMTRAGQVCAWIDVADALDPESAAGSGVELERLLWVRCGERRDTGAGMREARGAIRESPESLTGARNTVGRGGSPHPRAEGRDLPQAIELLLHAHGGIVDHQRRKEKRRVGTPGVANRPLMGVPGEREEQVTADRQPARRGENLARAHRSPLVTAPRCAEPQPRRVSSPWSGERRLRPVVGERAHDRKPWGALDQALRAADLLLQNGGFSAIVLDMGSTAPELAWRVPMATWFRFRAACERGRVSLILLTQHPCARSSAELVVRMEVGSFVADGPVMAGVRFRAEVQRNRSQGPRVVEIRKPPRVSRPGEWESRAVWAQTG